MTMTEPDIAECCKDMGRRSLVSEKQQDTENGVVTMRQERCSGCGRHHYLMIVPPIDLVIQGAEIG